MHKTMQAEDLRAREDVMRLHVNAPVSDVRLPARHGRGVVSRRGQLHALAGLEVSIFWPL